MTPKRDILRNGDEHAETAIAGRQVLGGGFRTLAGYDLTYLASDGEHHRQSRELIEGGTVTAVIAFDPVRDMLVMIRQYRFAAELATGKGSMIEICAGAVDEGETPEIAARRELEEETGLVPSAMVPAYVTMPTPGLTSEIAQVYLALVNSDGLPVRGGNDHDEVIEPFAASLDDLLAVADRGGIVNGFTLLALNWFARKGRAIASALVEGERT